MNWIENSPHSRNSKPSENTEVLIWCNGNWATARWRESGWPQVADEAGKLLSIVQKVVTSLERLGLDLSYLPPLRAFNVDDGSILLEWTFDGFRIGFSAEPNPHDSGWYLVSSKDLGEISAFGHTSTIDAEKLVMWLLSFALLNS